MLSPERYHAIHSPVEVVVRMLNSLKTLVKDVVAYNNPFAFVTDDHFSEKADVEDQKRLFKASIKMVEVEVFSYCNRTCWFCPNSRMDRVHDNKYMNEEVYLQLLRDLASIQYDGMLSYSRYNEPLADKIILERMRQARELVPTIQLHTNTNGDYLNPDYLEKLHEVGLRSINIQAYLKEREYTDDEATAVVDKILKRTKLSLAKVRDEKGIWLEYQGSYRDMKIRLYARNFVQNGADRGGLVDIPVTHERTSPCLSPFYHFYVDWDGSVVPCCNLRSDAVEHTPYVIGKLDETPGAVFRIYASEKHAAWRRSLISFGRKRKPCDTCSFCEIPRSPRLERELAKWTPSKNRPAP